MKKLFLILVLLFSLVFAGCNRTFKGDIKTDFSFNGTNVYNTPSQNFALGDKVVAYSKTTGSFDSLYLLNATSSKLIAKKGGSVLGISMNGDHLYCLFAEKNSFVFYNYDMKSEKLHKLHTVKENVSNSWMVVDNVIVYERLNGSIRDGENYSLVIFDGSSETTICNDSMGFSFDGKTILFVEKKESTCALKSFDLTNGRTNEIGSFASSADRAYISPEFVVMVSSEASVQNISIYYVATDEVKVVKLSEHPQICSMVQEYLFFTKDETKNLCRLNMKSNEEIVIKESFSGEVLVDNADVLYVYDFQNDCVNKLELGENGQISNIEIATLG